METKIATATSYATSGGLITAGVAYLDEHSGAFVALSMLIGALFGVLTFFVNWYYRHKESKK